MPAEPLDKIYPESHWSFRADVRKLDLQRILAEANEAAPDRLGLLVAIRVGPSARIDGYENLGYDVFIRYDDVGRRVRCPGERLLAHPDTYLRFRYNVTEDLYVDRAAGGRAVARRYYKISAGLEICRDVPSAGGFAALTLHNASRPIWRVARVANLNKLRRLVRQTRYLRKTPDAERPSRVPDFDATPLEELKRFLVFNDVQYPVDNEFFQRRVAVQVF